VPPLLLEPANDNEATPALSPREREVVARVARGLSNKDIGEQLFISQSAVATHLGRARRKLARRYSQLLLQHVRRIDRRLGNSPSLTAAERAVAALAAQGLSNRSIAELRGCSTHTVANQLSAVYDKLGGVSRRALRLTVLDPPGVALPVRMPPAEGRPPQRTSSMQNPLVQGTPLQQSAVVSQAWPYAEQVPPVPPVALPPVLELPPVPVVPPMPLSGTPPSSRGMSPQSPLVEPGRIVQGSPRQQSAVVVHEPPAATQLSPPQTNGGSPSGFGTHGKLQQSALEAHAWPT